MFPRRLPETVILLGALYCVGAIAHRLMTKVSLASLLSTENLLLLGLPAATAAGLLLALFLSRATRARLALALASLCAVIFPAELYVDSKVASGPQRAARAAGRPFDHRGRAEIVRNLRAQAVDAVVYPNVGRRLLTVAGPGGQVLPVLGGVSLATTVFCNESGQHTIYTADEHGFNNPYGLHGRTPLQVALIGDSYTHGFCVPAESSIAGRVRNVFPHTLNLGSTGSGPLSQLARFVEYAAPLRPRFVVWHWYEGNDLYDLRRELAQAPLRRYLTARSPFGLKARQAEIDRAARTVIDSALRSADNRNRWRRLEDVRSLLLLRSIRNLLPRAASPVPDGNEREYKRQLAVVEQVLATVRDAALSWGGELLMVYLPNSSRYCDAVRLWSWREYCRSRHVRSQEVYESHYRHMLAMFARLGLPVVDGHAAFKSHGLLADMFYYSESHYSPAGYRVIADALLRPLTTRPATAGSSHPE